MSDGGRVEAAARALFEIHNEGNGLSWDYTDPRWNDDVDSLGRDEYRRWARAVLAAADTAQADSDDELAAWRVGQHYRIHVYAGERPVATFFTAMDARAAVDAYNATLRPGLAAGAGTPGEKR